MKPLLLDRRGDAVPPTHCMLIQCERDLLNFWLRCAASSYDEAPENSSENRGLVNGAALCEWAEKAWRGRDWPCEEWKSPIEALLESLPNLSPYEATLLWQELGADREALRQPYQMQELLQVLYPAFAWYSTPSRLHAAEWLLWLDAQEIPLHYRLLVQLQAQSWHAIAEEEAPLYVASADEARAILRVWLHLETTETGWGEFPVPLPSRWIQEIRKSYVEHLMRDGIDAWETWQTRPLPPLALATIASASCEFLTHHRSQATPFLVRSLLPYVSSFEAARLRNLCPPAEPKALPQSAAQVLAWTTQQYLDFRLWQAETDDTAVHERVLKWARDFGLWYLDWYSGALSGIEVRYLATHCAERLRTSEEGAVVFWVIADGLGWADAQRLQHFLTQQNTRLSVTRQEAVFAPVPTITHFCKAAVRWGTTPAMAHNGTQLSAVRRHETEVSGHRDAAQVLAAAQPGDIVLWMPLEPDKTYHESADRSITHTNVEGALRALADNILLAIETVPSERTLRVVLSTDHGRLLGTSRRHHHVPTGCESHERTAYRSHDAAPIVRSYNAEGMAIEGDLVWLNPDQFGLPVECVIALDDGAFLTNNRHGEVGRGGEEEFPHGGVFPEEVVVPWIEIERDALVPTVRAQLSGGARAGTEGRLQLTLQNDNAFSLRGETLTLTLGATQHVWNIEADIAAYHTVDSTFELASWPTGSALRNAVAKVELRRSNGQAFSVTPALEVEAEEMQSRDDILGDLI